MFDLIKVSYENNEHISLLYEFLKERSYNISHEEMPDFLEHKEFIRNHSYRIWYLVKKNVDSKFLGSVYITNENIIGINLLSNKSEDYQEILKLIIKNHRPLPPLNSFRSRYFIVNSNPRNLNLIKALESLGMDHIQNTYAMKK